MIKAEQLVKLQQNSLMMGQGKGNFPRISLVGEEKKYFNCGKHGHIAKE